ncbi:MAG: RodZ domain-containing protein [Candidatus Omnitrophota bacterium]
MESIGSRLRSAREEKGISLEQAQKDTRISSRILSALETDKIDQMVSGPVYVKSFIKKYANYLGLDGNAVAESFSGQKPEFKEQISVLAKDAGGGGFPYRKVVAAVVAIVVMIAAVKLASFGISRAVAFFKSRPKAVKKIEPAKAKPAPKPAAKAAKEPAAPAVIPPAVQIPKGESIVLSVRSKADTYLKVRSDGMVIFDGTLEKGSEEKWEAKNSFEISTSKAEALSVGLNGTDIGALGKGAVKGLKLPK